MIVRSLWRCPKCLRKRRPAYSLHDQNAKRIICPHCGSHVSAEVKPKSRKVIPPRFRKIAIIALERAQDASAVLGPLNASSFERRPPNIFEHLWRLAEEKVILGVQLTVPPDFL